MWKLWIKKENPLKTRGFQGMDWDMPVEKPVDSVDNSCGISCGGSGKACFSIFSPRAFARLWKTFSQELS